MDQRSSLSSDVDYPSFEDQQALSALALVTRIFAWLTMFMPAISLYYFWLALRAPKGSLKPGSLAVLLALVVLTLAFTWLFFKAAACIRDRKGRALIYLAAVLACTGGPLGIALAIYTFVVMERPTIRPYFSR